MARSRAIVNSEKPALATLPPATGRLEVPRIRCRQAPGSRRGRRADCRSFHRSDGRDDLTGPAPKGALGTVYYDLEV